MNSGKTSDPQGEALLELAAGKDPERLARLKHRHNQGEPAPYLAGFLIFRGRRFAMDSRAYVTDPELSLLVDTVLREGDTLETKLGRPLRVLDFGVGAGTLALTIALERPHWTVLGLDIDPESLALAASNARHYKIELRLFQSDLLEGWPEDEPPPDLLYGDPPWGLETDLYDDERDAIYYDYMPRHTVFPPAGSRTGIHDALLRELTKRQWPTYAYLNYGVLPEPEIARSADGVMKWDIIEQGEGLSLLKASFSGRSCEV